MIYEEKVSGLSSIIKKARSLDPDSGMRIRAKKEYGDYIFVSRNTESYCVILCKSVKGDISICKAFNVLKESELREKIKEIAEKPLVAFVY